MNPERINETYQFRRQKRREIVLNFSGGSTTSDGGGMLLRAAEEKIGLLESVARGFCDRREGKKVKHSMLSMLTQRVFGIILGYEDLNDHIQLRNDVAFQTMIGKDSELASSATLCRFENQATREFAVSATKEMVEHFIKEQKAPPEELILDFDATDDLVHGNQEGAFFHGYYGNYCFLPLYVFCGGDLLVAYLRRSNQDGAKHSWAILSLLVKRFRQEWPNVKIVFRGDGGFCRRMILSWCEKNNVHYIVGLAKNPRLISSFQPIVSASRKLFEETQEKQRLFGDFLYAAKTWDIERRVIGKAEHSALGQNTRFIVTNLEGDPQELYDNIYCARGDMENKIKNIQLSLFSDRTSCSVWWSNQLRVIFSALAYVLVEYIRKNGLIGTGLENSYVHTIRTKLFKIGGVVTRNSRRIRFFLSSFYPFRNLFQYVWERLVPT